MKSVIALLVAIGIFMFGSNAKAQPLVGVIFDAPSLYTSDESKMEQLDQKLAEILPAEKCKLLPSKILTDKVQTYRGEHNMLIEGEPDAEQPLSSATLCEIGKQDGCDYILLLEMKRLSKTNESRPEYRKFNGRITSFSEKKSMILLSLTDIQVVNVATGQYEYKHEFLSVGETTTSKVFGIGSNPKESKTMDNLFKNFLKELDIKASAIP